MTQRLVRAVTAVAVVLAVALAGCGLGEPDTAAPPVTVRAEPVRYVAVGGSETAETERQFRRGGSWSRLLFRDDLPVQTVYVDLAESGATVADALADQVPLAVAQRPTAVTVWAEAGDLAAGTTPADYQAGLDAILARLDDTGAAVVILTSGDDSAYTAAADTAAKAHSAARIDDADDSDPAALAVQVAKALTR